jgi:hypothetical protein
VQLERDVGLQKTVRFMLGALGSETPLSSHRYSEQPRQEGLSDTDVAAIERGEAGAEVHRRVEAAMRTDAQLKYTAGLTRVLRDDPQLAAQYRGTETVKEPT